MWDTYQHNVRQPPQDNVRHPCWTTTWDIRVEPQRQTSVSDHNVRHPPQTTKWDIHVRAQCETSVSRPQCESFVSDHKVSHACQSAMWPSVSHKLSLHTLVALAAGSLPPRFLWLAALSAPLQSRPKSMQFSPTHGDIIQIRLSPRSSDHSSETTPFWKMID
jgi:hypothetical protein